MSTIASFWVCLILTAMAVTPPFEFRARASVVLAVGNGLVAIITTIRERTK